MGKVIKKEINGRQFELYCGLSCFSSFLDINIYEVVRPKWKIFRLKYQDTRTIAIDEWDDLNEACVEMLRRFLRQEAQDNARKEKIKNFEKSVDNE